MLRRGVFTPRVGQPALVVEVSGDGSGRASAQRHPEDGLDDLLAIWVKHHPLLDLAVLELYLEHVAVRPIANELTARSCPSPAGPHGGPFAPRVLVVALSGDDRAEQVAKRVGILDGSDDNVALERPQPDLNDVARDTPVAAR